MSQKVIATVTLVLASCLSAQNHPAWKTMAFSGNPAEMLQAAQRFPKVEDSGAQVLLEERKFSFDSSKATTYRLRRIYRVLTSDGANAWGTASVTWEPWQEEKPQIRARVISPDGTVHQADPATLAENAVRASDPNVLTDARQLTLPIPGVAPGAVVEEEFVVRSTRPQYTGGTFHRFSLNYGAPVQWSRFILEAPESLPLRYKLDKLPASALTKVTTDGNVLLTLESGPFTAISKLPALLPSNEPRYHGISFSTAESWQSFATAYSSIVDRQIEGSNLKSWTSNLKGSRAEKIASLIKRLHQEIRYTGIEFGESAIVPQKPAEVLRRKLGDCKDKSTLLVALLRTAGIPANLALLSSGGGYDIDPDLPGGGMFNHAIVHVPGSPEYWIDATNNFAELGEIDFGNQGRWALVASPDTTGLKLIPEGTAAANRTVEQREFFLPPIGRSRIVEVTEVRGAGASDFRRSYLARDKKEIKEELEKYVADEYLVDSLKSWDAVDRNNSSEPFTLRLEVENAKRGGVDQKSAVVGVLVSKLTNYLPDYFTTDPEQESKSTAPEKPRTAMFQIREPYSKQIDYLIHVPDGFQLRKTPTAGKRQLGVATFEATYGPLEKGVMKARLTFDSGKTTLTPAEAEETRKAILEFRKAPVPLIQFEQIGEALLSQGKPIEAMREFKSLCARNPASAMDRTRLARGLLAVGLGEAARVEARKATELDPKSATAWATLGWILQHDHVARLRQRGFDYSGAIAAYKKAKELDPEDASRTDLAILLEFDPTGQRYTTSSRLPEAVEEYKSMGKKAASFGVGENILFALLYLRRFEELKTIAAEMPVTATTRAMTLVAIANLENSAAALKEAAAWNIDDNSRRTVIQSASNLLLHLRQYPQSADFFTGMASGAQNSAALLNAALILRKTKKIEDIEFDASDPVSFFPQLYQAFLQKEAVAQASLEKLIATSVPSPVGIEELVSSAREIRKTIATSPLPSESVLDVGFASGRANVEGGKDFLAKVRLDFGGPGKEVLFLVWEAGAWKLVATEQALTPLGALALREVTNGKPENARKLLDWARELIPSPSVDDPLDGSLVARLWQKGEEAPLEKIRLAAAVLATGNPKDKEAMKILREIVAQQPADSTLRPLLELAQVAGQILRNEWDSLDTPTARLLQQFPRSQRAFGIRLTVLLQKSKFAEARQLAQARLKLIPDDPRALRALASIAESSEDYKTQTEIFAQLEKLGLTEATDLNSHIWTSLAAGSTSAQTVELALRATQAAPKSFAILHSASAVFAQQGKTNEAYSTMLQAMQAAGLEEPDEACWLVFGRIAQELGYPEVARARYSLLKKPEMSGPGFHLTSYAIAQKWLTGK